ncbi:MAG: beta-propeller fold lactonase family protein [Terriglobales bacterium]
MSFPRAARAALAGQGGLSRILVAVVAMLAALSLSCGSSSKAVANHSAYVTLPSKGSVLLLQIDGATGAITAGAQTPNQNDFTPTGLALAPSKKFLYAINSYNYTVSTFTVENDGTLATSANPVPVGSGPTAAIVDPSGGYLLVTNTFGNNNNEEGSISVFSIDPDSGALSELTASGSPFPANAGPTQIAFTHSGKFVYVTNPVLGMVTGFRFANGVLTQVPESPALAGSGAAALTVDGSDRFLYVANPAATNASPYENVTGNVSGFSIDANTGELTPLQGSPFVSTAGTEGPTAIAVDPTGAFVYAVTPGSSDSVWCFSITPDNGQLVEVKNSPFSVAAGGLFALFDPNGNYFYLGSQSAKGIEGYSYNAATGVLTAISGSPFSTAGAAPGLATG